MLRWRFTAYNIVLLVRLVTYSRVMTKTRSSAIAKSTARPSCLAVVLYDISRERICWWLINHFYAIGHDSYRVRRSNAKWPLRRSRSFKVTDFDTNRKPMCDFLLVDNTNLPPILHRFQVMANYWSNFQSSTSFDALAGVIPANMRISFTSPETRMIVLPNAENRTIVSAFIWTKPRNVSDGRTDGRTDREPGCYYSGLHCEQCGRAVKRSPKYWALSWLPLQSKLLRTPLRRQRYARRSLTSFPHPRIITLRRLLTLIRLVTSPRYEDSTPEHQSVRPSGWSAPMRGSYNGLAASVAPNVDVWEATL